MIFLLSVIASRDLKFDFFYYLFNFLKFSHVNEASLSAVIARAVIAGLDSRALIGRRERLLSGDIVCYSRFYYYCYFFFLFLITSTCKEPRLLNFKNKREFVITIII